MRGQLDGLGLVLRKWSDDSESNMKSLGTALLESNQAMKPTGNRYQLLKSRDLKNEALELVQGLRSLVIRTQSADEKLNDEQRTAYVLAKTPATRQQQWEILTQKEMDLYTGFQRQYETEYKVEAKLLREEMMRREGAHLDMKQIQEMDFMYENPTNPLGVTEVADDLERLAREIPDSLPRRRR